MGGVTLNEKTTIRTQLDVGDRLRTTRYYRAIIEKTNKRYNFRVRLEQQASLLNLYSTGLLNEDITADSALYYGEYFTVNINVSGSALSSNQQTKTRLLSKSSNAVECLRTY